MRLRLLVAFVLVLSMVIELSFDNTNSFVRVAADHSESALAVVDSSIQAGSSSQSTDQATLTETSSAAGQSLQDRSVIIWSLGHYAGPASSYTHFVFQSIGRLEARYVWHYRYIDRYTLLRPPIPA